MIGSPAVEPLTKAAFASFGEVIERPGAKTRLINAGTTERLHRLAAIDACGGRAIVSIFAGRRRPFPLVIAMLERHPLGSQCFVPLQPHDWLVVVGQVAEGMPHSLRCFRARGDQGINYAAGVWHHPLLILQPQQDFLVVDRDGPEPNCEECHFPGVPLAIELFEPGAPPAG